MSELAADLKMLAVEQFVHAIFLLLVATGSTVDDAMAGIGSASSEPRLKFCVRKLEDLLNEGNTPDDIFEQAI